VRICFLVLAHSTPKLYGRLVRTLTSEGDYVVTHVDAKADQDALAAEAAPSDSVAYLAERVDIKWGSWSMMRAEVAMFAHARTLHPDADYYWLLSGDTYPTRPLTAIHEFLDRSRGAEFINVTPMPDNEHAKPMRRISHYRMDFDARSDRLRLAKRAMFYAAPRPYRRLLEGRKPYGGQSVGDPHWVGRRRVDSGKRQCPMAARPHVGAPRRVVHADSPG
jgi:hypothetical protein